MTNEIILNTIRDDIANGTANALPMFTKNFPEMSDAHRRDVIEIISDAIKTNCGGRVSLVVTAPPILAIKARTTMSVVQSLLRNAKRNILITGYSLSSYCSNLIDTVVEKSQGGVFVKFFINNMEQQSNIDKILRYKGHFLQIYNFHPTEDEMAALHAKVISVDQTKTLITSANLSYHGQQGNIKFGALIDSKHIAKQIDEVFTKLIFSKVFNEI